MAAFFPIAAGVGLVWGLWKVFSGGGGGGGGEEPPVEPPVGPPVTPPKDKGDGGLVKVSPDKPEGTIADYNEFYTKGRNAVDQALYDESKASEDGETYCESFGCVGNLNHLTSAKKSIKTNQGRRGFDDGVFARAKELGLSIDENGDLSP